MRQFLLNLLSNAVKFTDTGQVTLRVTRLQMPCGRHYGRHHGHAGFPRGRCGQRRRSTPRDRFVPAQPHRDGPHDAGSGDGFEATRQLRLSSENDKAPIIATSASATAGTELGSREAGANIFIRKPIEQSDLLNAIADALGLTWIRE